MGISEHSAPWGEEAGGAIVPSTRLGHPLHRHPTNETMNTKSLRRGRNPKAGFSLAELMVVIVILGLLATLVVPQVVNKLKIAFGGKAKADINSIAQALDDYWINNQRYPDSLEELVIPDENGNRYLKQRSVPTDPWGNEYQYEPPYGGESTPRVFTLGADNAPGGDGENEDLSNWKLLGDKDE